jgi:hypothetical protein
MAGGRSAQMAKISRFLSISFEQHSSIDTGKRPSVREHRGNLEERIDDDAHTKK